MTGPPAGPPDDQVPICHWTNADQTWERVVVDGNGLNGHRQHDSDIIPPSDFGPGLNWSPLGELIWSEGCTLPEPEPTPTGLPSTGGADVALLLAAFVLVLVGVWLYGRGR